VGLVMVDPDRGVIGRRHGTLHFLDSGDPGVLESDAIRLPRRREHKVEIGQRPAQRRRAWNDCVRAGERSTRPAAGRSLAPGEFSSRETFDCHSSTRLVDNIADEAHLHCRRKFLQACSSTRCIQAAKRLVGG
jgi:hypothetical protein